MTVHGPVYDISNHIEGVTICSHLSVEEDIDFRVANGGRAAKSLFQLIKAETVTLEVNCVAVIQRDLNKGPVKTSDEVRSLPVRTRRRAG